MKTYIYTGTYQDQHWFSDVRRPNLGLLGTPAHGIGIGRYEFDADTGGIRLLGYTAAANNPATLWVSPDQSFVYVAHETKNFDGVLGAGGGVSAYRIDRATGDLTLINTVSSCGTFPAYVTTDHTGSFVVAANHASYFYNTAFERTQDGDYAPRVLRDTGSLALFHVRADGGLEEACDVRELSGCGHDVFNQMSAHPHAVEITRDGFVIAPDKGADCVHVFRLDRENGVLAPVGSFASEPGAAPRHLALHPRKPYVFVMNEFNNKIVSYRVDPDGRLEEIQRAFTVPMQYVGKSYTSCDIKLHPGGRFLYGTNHTFKSIVAYRVNEDDGTLRLIGNFREAIGTYREINFDPTGRYLVAGDMDADRVDVFAVDQDTGYLAKTTAAAPALYPSCVHFARLD